MATDTDAAPTGSGLDRSDALRGALAAVLVNLVGGLPAVLGGPDSVWFASLDKPALYPPSWLFGVVWTLLFTLIGFAVYLVYRRGLDDSRVQVALGLFVVSMALNVAWTPTFFALQNLAGGLAVIAALWVVLLPTVWAFDRVDRRSAALLVPYVLWVSFALVLNYQFFRIN